MYDERDARGWRPEPLIDAVRFYRQIGLLRPFPGVDATDDAAVVRALRENGASDPTDRWTEWGIIDGDRVWSRDMEDDVFQGHDAYVQILREWGEISGGCFTPTDIREGEGWRPGSSALAGMVPGQAPEHQRVSE